MDLTHFKQHYGITAKKYEKMAVFYTNASSIQRKAAIFQACTNKNNSRILF